MTRFGIFVFYDASGEVDGYVEALLESMGWLLNELIVIVNGKVGEKGLCKLYQYTGRIYVRENYGYDAGAYKDAFTYYLTEEELEGADEVILLNDSFYGPLYPWETVFEKMESEGADFWGLSRYPGGKLPDYGNEEIPAHIQGYFLACKKEMFRSPFWKEFWERLEYPATYWDAVRKYEIYFSEYFEGKGFRSKAWTDSCGVEIGYGENPYLTRASQLIKGAGFPVLKRKAVSLPRLDGISDAIKYIEGQSGYDVGLIQSHLYRLCAEGRMNPVAPFDPVRLEQFYMAHKRVFLYGHGDYGRGLARYFGYRGWDMAGFLVTENEGEEQGVLIYGRVELEEGDGVVLALGEKALGEVYPMIRQQLTEGQLYCPEH